MKIVRKTQRIATALSDGKLHARNAIVADIAVTQHTFKQLIHGMNSKRSYIAELFVNGVAYIQLKQRSQNE